MRATGLACKWKRGPPSASRGDDGQETASEWKERRAKDRKRGKEGASSPLRRRPFARSAFLAVRKKKGQQKENGIRYGRRKETRPRGREARVSCFLQAILLSEMMIGREIARPTTCGRPLARCWLA